MWSIGAFLYFLMCRPICLVSPVPTHSTFELFAIDLFSITRFFMVFPGRFLVESLSAVCPGYFYSRLQHLVHSFHMYRQTCISFACFATPFSLHLNSWLIVLQAQVVFLCQVDVDFHYFGSGVLVDIRKFDIM